MFAPVKHTLTAILALGIAGAAAGPAVAHPWHDRDGYDSRYDDRYGDYNDRYDNRYDRRASYDARYDNDYVELYGSGVDDLNPWLRNAKKGRIFVVETLGTNRVSERGAWVVNQRLYRSGMLGR